MTYLVVGDAERRGSSLAALRTAGIASDGAAPEELLHLQPIANCGLDGWSAAFRDKPELSYAGVVLVSPPLQLPWLDPGLLDWESGRPSLVAGLLAPGLANLYILGLGASFIDTNSAKWLIGMIRAQGQLAHPLVDELMVFAAPSHEAPAGRVARRLERRLQRRLDPTGPTSWWEAAGDPDGPLTAVRST